MEKAPPTRDPQAIGHVEATMLVDGSIPPIDVDGNFVVGPTHNDAPEISEEGSLLNGTIHEILLESSESKIFPGIQRKKGTFGTPDPNNPAKLLVTTSYSASYSRMVTVYVPNQCKPDTPFIVGADGPDRMLFSALDPLIADGRIPSMVASRISNGGGDAQGSQRGLEYDTMSSLYAEFVETEVLPRVEMNCGIRLTKNPEARAAMGCSSGASCALIMAWYRNDLYQRVLSLSGTFINQQWPHNPDIPGGAWEFHKSIIPCSQAKPLRIWLCVGDRDLYNPNIMRDNMHDWVLANQRMADVLSEKGYSYQFSFVRNAGHCDRAMKAQLLPQALEYLWQNYRD